MHLRFTDRAALHVEERQAGLLGSGCASSACNRKTDDVAGCAHCECGGCAVSDETHEQRTERIRREIIEEEIEEGLVDYCEACSGKGCEACNYRGVLPVKR